MVIRPALINDLEKIADLLDQLGYPGTGAFLEANMQRLIHDPNEHLLVVEDDGKVLAVISLHFLPQLAVEGDFARISYFSVDKDTRGQGIGNMLESYCEQLARERKCDRMEVHCHARRSEAHRFYARQGYTESPKYLVKDLTVG